MNAPLARLTPAASATGAERRRAPRFTAWHPARLQARQGRFEEVLLTDVSTHGCCVRSDSPNLRVGAILAIGVGEHPMLPAMVRWVRDGSAGMEFLRPIPHEREEWHYLMDLPQ